MKKALLVLCAIIAFSFGSKAQSFEGTHYGTLSITWEQNTDLIIEKTKAAIDEMVANAPISDAKSAVTRAYIKSQPDTLTPQQREYYKKNNVG